MDLLVAIAALVAFAIGSILFAPDERGLASSAAGSWAPLAA